MHRPFAFALSAVFALAACSSSDPVTGGSPDAATTDGHDGGAKEDASVDATTNDARGDDATPGLDAGADVAEIDAPSEASSLDGASDARAVDADVDACTVTAYVMSPRSVALYVMFDQSGSMKDTAGGSTSKWVSATGGLEQFLAEPATSGIDVGLQYFGLAPSSASTCTNGKACGSNADCAGGSCLTGVGCVCPQPPDSCVAADYAQAAVEIAAVPGVTPDVTKSLGAHSPSTSSPISAALQGALDHAKTWAQGHVAETTSVVFMTDGSPSECDTDETRIASIAAAAVAGSPSVATFVVGFGPPATFFQSLATAGGTGTPYMAVDPSSAATTLETIRARSGACTYATTTAGLAIDPAHAQVETSHGGATMGVAHVADAAGCAATGQGWYAEGANAATVTLCPATCADVRAAAATVQVRASCN